MDRADEFSNGSEGEAATGEAGASVVLLYENRRLGDRAESLLQGLSTGRGLERKMHLCSWQFDSLHATWFGLHAKHALAHAKMIVVAADGNRSLSSEITDGLKRWLVKNGSKGQAMVALLEADQATAKQPNRAFGQLETLARQNGLDFFAHISRPEVDAIGLAG